MKIKLSFITNSSSCTYVTFVPPRTDLLRLARENDDCEPELNPDIKKLLERIPDQEHIFYGDEDDYDGQKKYEDFHKVIWIITKLEFPIAFIEDGSENYLYLMNIADEKNIKKIRRILEDEF